VPSEHTPRIQEAHMTVGHIIAGLVEHAVNSEESPIAKLGKVKLVALDFDGVLTDNRVLVSSDGTEQVLCSREDSLGIALLKKNEIEVIVISKEQNQVVEQRCQKLGIACKSGINNKYACLKEEAQARNLLPSQVCFVGNDVTDEECIREAGVGVAVADAMPSTKRVADYITLKKGGKGAVREVADIILQKRHG